MVEDEGKARFCPRTDGQMDGHETNSIPPFNSVETRGILNISVVGSLRRQGDHVTTLLLNLQFDVPFIKIWLTSSWSLHNIIWFNGRQRKLSFFSVCVISSKRYNRINQVDLWTLHTGVIMLNKNWTHLPLVPLMCVSESVQQWFR